MLDVQGFKARKMIIGEISPDPAGLDRPSKRSLENRPRARTGMNRGQLDAALARPAGPARRLTSQAAPLRCPYETLDFSP